MDRQLVNQKLESLRRCIQRVESRLPPDLATLMGDLDAQDIISLNLTRAIQMCVDIGAHWLAEDSKASSPRTMGQTFDALADAGIIDSDLATRMRKSVGFQNVVVHNYDEVDWEIVYSICRHHLVDFKAFAKAFS